MASSKTTSTHQQLATYGAVIASPEEEKPNETDPLKPAQAIDISDKAVSRPQFRDVPFTVLFLIQLLCMLYLGIMYGTFGQLKTAEDTGNGGAEDMDIDLAKMEIYARRVLLYFVLPVAAVSFLFGYFATAVVIPSCPIPAVTSCLVLSLASSVFFAVMLCLAHPAWYSYLAAVALVGFTAFYITIVWRLIPFAAVNLEVSLRGVSTNWGIYLLAVLCAAIGSAWFIGWAYVANGVLSSERLSLSEGLCKDAGNNGCQENENNYQGKTWGTLFLLLLSLYWTNTTLLNTLQVTVAGVMGTWCFEKTDASTCCSPAVYSSFYRSVTYSFGSICFGSLLEGLVTALRVIVETARNQSREDNEQCSGEAAILLCILECILKLLEDIIEYFNTWAYVYVGIYGYGYLESGRKVMELFRARGWTAVITNDLVGYVLSFTSITVGLFGGLFAIIIELLYGMEKTSGGDSSSFLFGSIGGPQYWAFGIGFIISIVMVSVMMNVVRGAVNTLIVCFAEAPARMEENHPESTHKMAAAWTSVFPDSGARVLSHQPVYDVAV